MASEITGNSTVGSANVLVNIKNQSFALLALCEEKLPLESPHKVTVMRESFPFHDVIMNKDNAVV